MATENVSHFLGPNTLKVTLNGSVLTHQKQQVQGIWPPFYYVYFLVEIFNWKEDYIKNVLGYNLATFLSQNNLQVERPGCGDFFKLEKPRMPATFTHAAKYVLS